MKDTLVTVRRKRIELATAGVCLLLAFLLNVGCILYYRTPFVEVFTQLGYVVAIAVGLYLAWTAIRLVFRLFRKR